MSPAEARRRDAEEFAAESADLMRRALEHSAAMRGERSAIVLGRNPIRYKTEILIAPKAKTPVKRSKSTRIKTVNLEAEIEFDGVSKSILEWSRINGLQYHNIYQRLRKGISPREALMTPVRQNRRSRPVTTPANRGQGSNFV